MVQSSGSGSPRFQALARTTVHQIEGEDLALALLEFESGAVASLEATTCAWPGYPRRVEISGTEGTVVVEGDDVVAAVVRLRENPVFHGRLSEIREEADGSVTALWGSSVVAATMVMAELTSWS